MAVYLMRQRFDTSNSLMKEFLAHCKRDKCVHCTGTPPTLPLAVYCSYGRRLVASYNAIMTRGWERMSFWDGEPEPFSFGRSWTFSWLGNFLGYGTFDWAWKREGWRQELRAIFGRKVQSDTTAKSHHHGELQNQA